MDGSRMQSKRRKKSYRGEEKSKGLLVLPGTSSASNPMERPWR
jgi:hypothetical protein